MMHLAAARRDTHAMVETEATLEIKELISKFSPDPINTLAVLHAIQHRYGYIPSEAVPLVAAHFHEAPAKIFGVITFYSEFRRIPPPATLVTWCSGPACRLRGGERIREVLEAELGITMEQNTPDNRVGLHLGQCNGTCEHAPQVWVNSRVVGPLTVPDAIRLVRDLKAGGSRE